MSGYSDGLFYPQNAVTINEVTQSLVSALGYSSRASAMRDNSMGYLIVGRELGLYNGIPSNNGIIDRGTIAAMAYNALSAEVAEATVYRGEDEVYTVTKDKSEIINVKLTPCEAIQIKVSGEGRVVIPYLERIYKTSRN